MRISGIEKTDKEMTIHLSKNRGKAVKRRFLEKIWDMADKKEKVIVVGDDVDPLDLENQRQTCCICIWINPNKTEVWTEHKWGELPYESHTFDYLWRMGRLITPNGTYGVGDLYKLKRQYKIIYDNWLGQPVWRKKIDDFRGVK